MELVTLTIVVLLPKLVNGHEELGENGQHSHQCIHNQLESLLHQYIYQTSINYPIDWIDTTQFSSRASIPTNRPTLSPSISNTSVDSLHFIISSDNLKSPLDRNSQSSTIHTIDRTSSTHWKSHNYKSTKNNNTPNNADNRNSKTNHNRRVMQHISS